MIFALLAYLEMRLRTLGHAHEYGRWIPVNVGGIPLSRWIETPFCVICGKYR